MCQDTTPEEKSKIPIGVKEAATLLNLSMDTIKKRADNGDIPHWRTQPNGKGHRRFWREDVLEYRRKMMNTETPSNQ